MQVLMTMVPLVEVQSSRTQRPTAGTSYPYVDLTLGDMNTQRVIQLQLEQVLHIQEPVQRLHGISSGVQWRVLNMCLCPQGLELCRVIAMQVKNMMSLRDKRLTLPPSEITML